MKEYNYIRFFNTLSLNDISLVGGKNASLGQMIYGLSCQGIKVPQGFAITVDAYWHVLKHNDIIQPIKQQLALLMDSSDIQNVHSVGKAVRDFIMQAQIPSDLVEQISIAYATLSQEYGSTAVDVAVRSSATAEDLPGASFAGQQESYLNVSGITHLLHAYQCCLASLFGDRALIYRMTKGFDHFAVGLSVGVQKMVRADRACSGVAFSLDTESGFKDVVLIEAAYGLGELVVQGQVDPDQYTVFKPMVDTAYDPIIAKKVGAKKTKLVYALDSTTVLNPVVQTQSDALCLSDQEIIYLARMVMQLEQYYTNLVGHWTPLDVEWAKDGIDNQLYIVQARPETVHALESKKSMIVCELAQHDNKILLEGLSIGQQIATGSVAVINTLADASKFKEGSILVTRMTDPDWLLLMRKSAGIITDLGGRTCHAAIVARELGIPALVGTVRATSTLVDKQEVTVDCSQGSTGFVYEGVIAYSKKNIDISRIKRPSTTLLVNIADPARAFSIAQLPYVQGVGLARLEFMIAAHIKAHPMAFIAPEKIKNPEIFDAIKKLSYSYADSRDFFIDTLAQGIATIGAAFWPRMVIVRFSDFKSNEYANLLGGSYYEPKEENPMLGLRGASRYYNSLYAPAFELEVAAVKKAREHHGLRNIAVMLPFVRTTHEATSVIQLLQKNGLKRGDNELKLFMMVEIPSNVILLGQFCQLFDGFSIGSNDLTQFALAVDRDSALLSSLFDERDAAVKEFMRMAITTAHKHKKYIGICGQAPSDYPEVGTFLVNCGIDSLSLNPDAILSFLLQQ